MAERWCGRPFRALVVVAGLAVTAACGGGAGGEQETPTASAGPRTGAEAWSDGQARVTLEAGGAVLATFDGGACSTGALASGRDAFRLRAGTPGAAGEGIVVALGLELVPGASVTGDGTGNGVQVDHDGRRWRLASGPAALQFDEDLGGGVIRLTEQEPAGVSSPPALARFRC